MEMGATLQISSDIVERHRIKSLPGPHILYPRIPRAIPGAAPEVRDGSYLLRSTETAAPLSYKRKYNQM